MLYWQVFKFHLNRFKMYPFEVVAEVAKRFIWIFFLMFFWTKVAESSDTIVRREIISYFLVSAGITDLIMGNWGFLASDLGNYIKMGRLNNYLLKPVNIVLVFYIRAYAMRVFTLISTLVLLIAGLIISRPSITTLLVFLIIFTNAFIISFAHNVIEASAYFIFTEATGFRNALRHLMSVLSGTMVPLYLLPDTLKKIIFLTPYPAMTYAPVRLLTLNEMTPEIKQLLITGAVWSVIISIAAYFVWNNSKKKYEAIGI